MGPAIIDQVRIGLVGEEGDTVQYPSWQEAGEAMDCLGLRVAGRAELSTGSVMEIDYRSIYGDQLQAALNPEPPSARDTPQR